MEGNGRSSLLFLVLEISTLKMESYTLDACRFAAALKDIQVWVLNVVNFDSPDTLPIIYERGLFGIYHDWCESFSTYPRSYDLLHADHLFSKLKKRLETVARYSLLSFLSFNSTCN